MEETVVPGDLESSNVLSTGRTHISVEMESNHACLPINIQ
jgi:hypothetical protein